MSSVAQDGLDVFYGLQSVIIAYKCLLPIRRGNQNACVSMLLFQSRDEVYENCAHFFFFNNHCKGVNIRASTTPEQQHCSCNVNTTCMTASRPP